MAPPGWPGFARPFVLESVNCPGLRGGGAGAFPVAVEPAAETFPVDGVLTKAAFPLGLAAGEFPVAVEPCAETMPPR